MKEEVEASDVKSRQEKLAEVSTAVEIPCRQDANCAILFSRGGIVFAIPPRNVQLLSDERSRTGWRRPKSGTHLLGLNAWYDAMTYALKVPS
jgi:hypothetical protein